MTEPRTGIENAEYVQTDWANTNTHTHTPKQMGPGRRISLRITLFHKSTCAHMCVLTKGLMITVGVFR